jgi:hypothetical protein
MEEILKKLKEMEELVVGIDLSVVLNSDGSGHVEDWFGVDWFSFDNITEFKIKIQTLIDNKGKIS